MTARFPQFEQYKGDKAEFEMFRAGTKAYRHKLLEQAYCYLLTSPGERTETDYFVRLGWGFGDKITETNYLEQIRALDDIPDPSEKFETGFWTLGEIERKQAHSIESIPARSRLSSNPDMVTDDQIEQAVKASVLDVMDRLAVQIPLFEDKILQAAARRQS